MIAKLYECERILLIAMGGVNSKQRWFLRYLATLLYASGIHALFQLALHLLNRYALGG
jgi:hypothetical protein